MVVVCLQLNLGVRPQLPVMFRMLEAMLHRLVQAMIWSTGCSGLLPPSHLVAQDSTYFEVLSVPPASLGTCVSPRPQDSASDVVARGGHLVITSIAPNRRREIAFLNAVKGDATSFMDIAYRSTGLLYSNGDNVVAIIDSAGRVRGFRQHMIVQLSDSGSGRLDTLELRAMRELRQSSAKPLDARAQRKVQHLVDWLRKRCPN
jgi:hypothetical protein